MPGRGNVTFEREDATRLAEQASGRRLSPGEVSDYWVGRAVADIRSQPGPWFRLLGRKLLLTVNAGEVVDTESIEFYAENSRVLGTLFWFNFGVLLPIAALGAWLARDRWRQLTLLYAVAAALAAATAAFYVLARYRFPIVPVAMLFGGVGLVGLVDAARAAWRGRIGASAAVWPGLALASLAAVVANVPLRPVGDDTRLNVAEELLQAGRPDEALPLLEREAAISPDYARARLGLGVALSRTGDKARSLEEFEKAVSLAPSDFEARSALALGLAESGEASRALEHFREAVRLRPGDAKAQFNLANALQQAGRAREAIPHYDAALRARPDYVEAMANLALALAETGDTALAIDRLSRAAGLRPDSAPIHFNLAELLSDVGRSTEALAHYDEAARLSPDSPDLHFALAQAYARGGRSVRGDPEPRTGGRPCPGVRPRRSPAEDRGRDRAVPGADQAVMRTAHATMAHKNRRLSPTRVLLAVAIATAGVWAYAPSLRGVFLWDDRPGIVENPHLRTLRPITSAMSAPRDTTLAGRPVASLTFALNYALAPEDVRDVMKPEAPSGPPDLADPFYRNVWGYHALNLAVHLLAALTLFGVLRRTLLSAPLSGRFGTMATGLAFATALIWVVHPLNTQAVTYVVQRVECLMGLFYLLTLYCAIRALDRPATVGRWWAGAAVLACGLGMGTKESMVTAPLVVWMWDWLFVAPDIRRRRWPLYLGLASTWLLLAYLVSADNRPHSVGVGLGGWTSSLYLQTQFGVLVHYLRLAVVPAPLVFDYHWPAVASFPEVLPQALVLAVLASLTGFGLYLRRPPAFAGAWFFLLLAPTSSVLPIPTEVAAEHRMYLPLVAVIGLIVIGGGVLGRRLFSTVRRRLHARLLRTLCVVVVGMAVVVLGLLTRARNERYQSEEVLLADTVQKRPANSVARLAYGSTLLARQRFAEAEAQMRVVLTLEAGPDTQAHAHMFLGSALCAQGRLAEGVPAPGPGARTRPHADRRARPPGGGVRQPGTVGVGGRALPTGRRGVP